jgi:hypothetical protein
MDAALDPYSRARGNRPGLASRAGQFLFDTGGDIAFPGYLDRSRQNVAARFNRRYGTGGTRAAYGRSISRGIRGFGKGALIAGGITAGLGLLGMGSANAAEMGEGQGMGAGQAFGAIGMGAAEGALTGAMFGPWGAAIGGVLGAGIALMDKGTRDAAGKWVSNLMSSIGRFTTQLIDGTGKFIQGIVKFFITDLPSVWLKGMNALYVELPKKLIEFGQALGKNMLESVYKFDLGEALRQGWENLKTAVTGAKPQAVGGNVQRGSMYLVGERGPELFRATADGNITNSATLTNLLSSSGRGGSTTNATFNVSINVNGNMGAGDVESLRGPVLAIIQDAWNEVTYGTVTRGSVA